ncbi:hypothetical protein KJ836_00045 [Patescibacteria group bacterium]|nr:hypothetical protein [Patescibacteria group bacterium]
MWQQIKETIGLSVIQAIGASAVVWLWSLVMTNLSQVFQNTPDTATTFVLFLLIFMITAVLAGGAVLGYPLYLVLHERKWGTAITLVVMSLVWLGLIAATIVLIATR